MFIVVNVISNISDESRFEKFTNTSSAINSGYINNWGELVETLIGAIIIRAGICMKARHAPGIVLGIIGCRNNAGIIRQILQPITLIIT